VKVLEKAVEDAFGTENGFPGIATDEVAHPEGNDDELIEEFLAQTSMKGHVVGERIAEKQREECNACGDAHRAEEHFDVDRILKQLGVVLQIPFVNDGAIVQEPETVRKHKRVGQKKKETNPEEGREGNDRFVGARVHRSFQFSVISRSSAHRRTITKCLTANGNGVLGEKSKFVFTGKRAACGNADAQRLAGAIHFELFAGAGKNLLADESAEAHGVRCKRPF